MAHFYLSEALAHADVGDTISVVGSEATHAVTVARLRVGELTTVGNGSGLVVRGTVTSAGPTEFQVRVDSAELEPEPRPAIWLAQALAKGDRDELAIQAATELGVDGVIPWAATRSVVRWEGTKLAKRQDRWQAIVREAAKQSMRARIPRVHPLASTAQLAALAAERDLVVLDPDGEARLGDLAPRDRDLVLVVGPEGGIAPAELDLLAAAGATTRRLGSSVLRTSTAGPAALAVLNVTLQRW